MHYLMFYEYSADYLERRATFRSEHLRLAWESVARGELVLGGAFADPADVGTLLFNIDSPDIAKRFAENDPYVKNGLVTRWWVRAWTTVVGHNASTPIR